MNKFHKYQVRRTWGGAFPLDMLSYDQCWPSNTVDAVNMARASSHREFIRLTGVAVPTSKRWESFGWEVHHDDARAPKITFNNLRA